MQTETTQRRLMWWGINILVLLYAFVPVFWLISLSLKDAATLNDGNYFPTSPTDDSYAAIFTNNDFIRANRSRFGKKPSVWNPIPGLPQRSTPRARSEMRS